MLANVNINILDGALGILPQTDGDVMAIAGPSDAGPLNTPTSFARGKYVQQNFGDGPLVESACHAIERYGKPVVLVRTATTNAGSYGALDTSGVTGTSVVTLHDAVTPVDHYEILFVVVHGGTIGAAGITYQYSLDGGRTMSPVKALGTANFVVLEMAARLDLAAGTLLAGDRVSVRAKSPVWSATDLGTALAALTSTRLGWDFVQIAGELDPVAFDTVDAWLQSLEAAGRFAWAIGNARMPDEGESEAAYLSSLSAAFAAKSSTSIALAAGAAKVLSSVTRRMYRRPVSLPVSAKLSALDLAQSVAQIGAPGGALAGVDIRDGAQNVDMNYHDESDSPGLDDARFLTLRTWDSYPGAFVTFPRIFAPPGSDFERIEYRRVMNAACKAIRNYMLLRLQKPVRVDRKTGFILEADAREIEAGATNVLNEVLLKRGRASAATFALSRTDNVLSTKRLTGDGRIVPLAYPVEIDIAMGFTNPALAA
jgi:hypothetical protein